MDVVVQDIVQDVTLSRAETCKDREIWEQMKSVHSVKWSARIYAFAEGPASISISNK